MSALDQYIRLYEEASAIVDAGAAPVLNAPRAEALRALKATGLPKKGSENYEHTDLEAMLAPDFGLNLRRAPLDFNPAAALHCGLPNLGAPMFILVNDSFAAPSGQPDRLPEGVTVMSLRQAALQQPELVARYYGKAADITNPIVALDTLFAQDGVFIHIAPGVRMEGAVQLVDILDGLKPIMAVRRILIVVCEGAEGKLLICDHSQNPDVNFLSLQTIEIFAERDSRFDIYDLEESSALTGRLSALYVSQEEHSNVLVDGITLYNGTTRNEYHALFKAPHSELRLLGMGIEDDERCLETYSRIDHSHGHCHTEELMKFTVDDCATASFTGRIYVAPGAEKTTAYQSNRNIVGGDKATMYSKPQLEIYNDDVKCSHGTAIGQLDAMQLFYMRTRGLDEATARLLLKQAFMADVIDGVRLPALKDRLRILVERRFAGEHPSCRQCHLNA